MSAFKRTLKSILYRIVSYLEDHARRQGVEGVWDAVDTSPDIGGQNVLKTFEMASPHNTNGIRQSFLSLDLFSLTFENMFWPSSPTMDLPVD